MSTEQPAPHLYETEDNFELLAQDYSGSHFVRMRLVFRDPFVSQGYGAVDKWFFGKTKQELDTNVMRHIKQYGILQAYAHRPEEKQHESNTQVSESGS